jgi:branched-chain amino acid transport system substrate-binding protein
MTKTRSTAFRAAAALTAVAFAVAACGSSSKKTTTGSTVAPAAGKTLKIGFFGALTGSDAALGINIENGEKLAIQQYMAGNPPVKVVIDPFDSQGDPSQAANGAQKLIADKVVALIGPAFSGESAAADPYFEQAGIPNITASATNVTLAQKGFKYFHRALADDSVQGPGDANYIVKTLGAGNVAVIDDSSTYGEGLANYVRAQLKVNGGKDVLDDHVDPNGQDYSSTVNKILTATVAGSTTCCSGKVHAVFYGGYYDAAGRLVKQLRDAGYTDYFMSGDGSEDPHFITDAGQTAGSSTGAAEGAYLSCACEDTSSAPNAASFNSAYQAAFGTPPQIYSAEAYDATNFLLAAIKAGNTTPSSINKYLATNSWVGVTKTLKFLPNGNVAGGTVYVYQVKDGKITQIGTTS